MTVIHSRWVLALAAGLCMVAGAEQASAIKTRPVTLDEVIDQSDLIFVAVVGSKTSSFRAGNIVTTYKLKPSDVWQGQLALDSDGTVTVEELGGSLNGTLPLAQHITGRTPMIVGEEVLLFTKTYNPGPTLLQQGVTTSLTVGSPILVSLTLGRYSVLTDSDTGRRYVVRPDLGSQVSVAGDFSLRTYLATQEKVLKRLSVSLAQRDARRKTAPLKQQIRNFDSFRAVKERIMARLVVTGRYAQSGAKASTGAGPDE